jgi:hypothetical protein
MPDADTTLFGGHIMAMNGSKMFVDGVELNRMGQNMHLARYPIHWHPQPTAVLVVALAAEEEAEARVELLSRQSFSAAMARSTT